MAHPFCTLDIFWRMNHSLCVDTFPTKLSKVGIPLHNQVWKNHYWCEASVKQEGNQKRNLPKVFRSVDLRQLRSWSFPVFHWWQGKDSHRHKDFLSFPPSPLTRVLNSHFLEKPQISLRWHSRHQSNLEQTLPPSHSFPHWKWKFLSLSQNSKSHCSCENTVENRSPRLSFENWTLAWESVSFLRDRHGACV
jgi:hypothetical protein